MFTTLKITVKPRKSLLERLHLVKKRKFITLEHKVKDTVFYTTELISYSKENTSAIRTFRRRADMPVITKKSECYRKIRYIAYANTAFSLYPPADSVSFYDTSGELAFLIPYVAGRCGSITVFTRKESAYTDIAGEVYRDFGTPVIFVPNAGLLKSADILFSPTPLPFKFNKPYFGNGQLSEAVARLPLEIPTLPPDTDTLAVVAGLYFIEKIKSAGDILFSEK